MKNSYIYQVSTEDQAKEGYSLDVQREYLESFAKRGSLEYLSGRPYIGLNFAPFLYATFNPKRLGYSRYVTKMMG